MKQTINALIVEDNPADALLLKRYLESIPFAKVESAVCNNEKTALVMADTYRPDIVFVDFMLGPTYGTGLIQRLKEEGCKAAFILLTGMSDKETVIKAFRAGADDYLSKTELSIESLSRSLRFTIERKMTADKLKESEERLQAIIDNTSSLIYVKDIEGRYILNNKKYEELFHIKRDEITGLTDDDIFSKDFAKAFRKNDRMALDTGSLIEIEEVTPQDDGDHTYLSAKFPLRDAAGEIYAVCGVSTDITDLKRKEEKIKYQAYYDSLTSLPNRTLFNDHLERALARARRNNSKFALMFLDLDDFKNINDSLGHMVGDLLLRGVSVRLASCIRESDIVARLGGDEFVILLEDISHTKDVINIAEKITDTLSDSFCFNGKPLYVTTSIGITIYPEDGKEKDSLIKNADLAMYKAKEKGKSGWQIFTPDLNAKAVKRHTIETELRLAIKRNEFVVYYQPKVMTATGEITGVEALVRWKKPDGTMAPPSEFIPVAEETGLIIPIGRIVLKKALRQAGLWQRQGFSPIKVSVNLSPVQFRNENIVDEIEEALNKAQIAPQLLDLEITESMVMGDVESAVDKMKKLKLLGVELSIDDFGAGYSSLGYLKDFPIDNLKIDQSFIQGIENGSKSSAIVNSIIMIAQNLGLKGTAEGVETVAHVEFLREKGCDEMQGYFICPPLPAAEFIEYIEEYQPAPLFAMYHAKAS